MLELIEHGDELVLEESMGDGLALRPPLVVRLHQNHEVTGPVVRAALDDFGPVDLRFLHIEHVFDDLGVGDLQIEKQYIQDRDTVLTVVKGVLCLRLGRLVENVVSRVFERPFVCPFERLTHSLIV